MTQKILLYVGTYTHYMGHLVAANGQGIHIFELDGNTGELHAIGHMAGLENPSYLSIDASQRYLYAVQEKEQGMITAYAIDPQTGQLRYLNEQSSLGSSPAYVEVDQSSRHVLAVNYSSGQSVMMYSVNDDGSLAVASHSHEHTEQPEGTVADRQDKSHAHCVVVDPTNTYAVVCDLGLDKLFIYQLDALKSHTPSFIKVASGAGPRHLTFHPDGKMAYLINELNSSIIVLAYTDDRGGVFEIKQTVSTLPDDYQGFNYCSDIHVTASGKFLYAANRGHDSISSFLIDEQTGLLSPLGYKSTQGEFPRTFAIDPTGTFLLVANQNSDNIVTFRINQNTGELQDTGHVTVCGTPVCLKLVAY